MKKTKLTVMQNFLNKNDILTKIIDCDTIRDRAIYNKHFIDHDEWVIMGQICSAGSVKGTTHMQTLLLSRRNTPFTLKVGQSIRVSWNGFKLSVDKLSK